MNDKPKREMTVYERIDTAGYSRDLPATISEERFVRSIKSTLALNPGTRRIASTPAGADSLILACSKAAADGLIIDGREAALVPMTIKIKGKNGEQDRYEERLQYIPMVQGLLKRARNSGVIASITAQVVYKNDRFLYTLGDDEKIIHEPLMEGDRGPGVAVYAIATMKDGLRTREVMLAGAVMAIASQSKNKYQYDQKDGKNWGEWWRKTVIRRIVKYIASSSDVSDLSKLIEHSDEEFDFEAEADRRAAAPAGKRRGGAAAALRDVTPPKPGPEDENQDVDYGDGDDVPDKTIDHEPKPGDPI